MAKKKEKPATEVKVAKTMSSADINAMTKEDLAKKAGEIRLDVVALRRAIASGTTQNYKMVSLKRKELARTLTALQLKTKEEK